MPRFPVLRSRRVWVAVRATALVVWLSACIVVSALLLASHLLTVPLPGQDIGRAIALTRTPGDQGRWLVVHFLFADCGCSQRVRQHLLESKRPTNVVERIVWIEANDARPPFPTWTGELERATPRSVERRYHVEAAPLFVIVSPDDEIQYVGGYTARKQADDVRDLRVIAAVTSGEHVEPLPAFGCAVGSHLTSTLDPLGLRAWR